MTFLGSLLIAVAVAMLVSALRKPEAGESRPWPDRTLLGIGAGLLIAGAALLAWPQIAMARLRPVPLLRTDAAGQRPDWIVQPPAAPGAPIRWEGDALVADLEAGSGRYAVFPVDWNADRFSARFEIVFERLDLPGSEIPLNENGRVRLHRRTALDHASVAIGLMDQNVANIDDRDHVSGSAIQACFSTDIRLRASDANYLLRTAAADESGKARFDPDFRPGPPVRIELGKRYRCALDYDTRSDVATLAVRDEEGREVAFRRLEDLPDFTNSVAWFGVSVRGYNRFDKKMDARKKLNGYVRPRAVVRLENLEYRQP